MEIVNSRHRKDEQKKSPKPLKRILRITFGVFFLALGIIGIFLPILQGIFFIVIGLLLLAPYSTFIRKCMNAFGKKTSETVSAGAGVQEEVQEERLKPHPRPSGMSGGDQVIQKISTC